MNRTLVASAAVCVIALAAFGPQIVNAQARGGTARPESSDRQIARAAAVANELQAMGRRITGTTDFLPIRPDQIPVTFTAFGQAGAKWGGEDDCSLYVEKCWEVAGFKICLTVCKEMEGDAKAFAGFPDPEQAMKELKAAFDEGSRDPEGMKKAAVSNPDWVKGSIRRLPMKYGFRTDTPDATVRRGNARLTSISATSGNVTFTYAPGEAPGGELMASTLGCCSLTAGR